MAESLVAVIGVGGVGSHCAHGLLRAGIRRLRLVDFDRVSLSSLNRHAVASRRDVGTPKVTACAAHFDKICPGCEVDARDEMFTAESASRLLGGCRARPDVVVDCIDDVPTKCDLLEACITMGIPVISALGSGAKGDPTKLCVACGLRDVENDALATKLRSKMKDRSLDVSKVPFVYSSQRAEKALLPLTAEQRANPGEFGNVKNFRLRTIPVLGTQPAAAGIALAVQVISFLSPTASVAPRPLPALSRNSVEKLLENLKKHEKQSAGGRLAVIDVTVAEATYLASEVWRGRSAINQDLSMSGASGSRFTFARWDNCKPVVASNLVLVSEGEAFMHLGQEAVAMQDRARVEAQLEKVSTACVLSTSRSLLAPLSHPEATAGCNFNGPIWDVWKSTERKLTIPEEQEAKVLLEEQLSRSSAFFGEEAHAHICNAFVVVIGAGAAGSAAASLLVRAGIRRLRMVDDASYAGSVHAVAVYADSGIPKTHVCCSAFQAMRPCCQLEGFVCRFEEATADHVLRSQDGSMADVVLDCTGGSVEQKAILLRALLERNVQVVTVALRFGLVDPTRMVVSAMSEAHACPFVSEVRAKLQKFSSTKLDTLEVAHSQELPAFMPDANWARQGCENLCRFELGIVGAAVVLHKLAAAPVPRAPPSGFVGGWKKLLRSFPAGRDCLDPCSVGCIVEQIWRGRSALSGCKGSTMDGAGGMRLALWDKSKPASVFNVVLVTDDEALRLEEQASSDDAFHQQRERVQLILENVWRLLQGRPRSTFVPSKMHRAPKQTFAQPLRRRSHVACPGAVVVGAATVGLLACSSRSAAGARAITLSALAASVATYTWTSSVGFPRTASDGSGARLRTMGNAGFSGLIGGTPLMELSSLSESLGRRIVGKAEFLNPGGCQKDRVAFQIVTEAEASGALRPGAEIFEGTSGSTGISLALIGAERGYRVHVVMPDDQAQEKVQQLQRFGAEVELVRPASISSPEHYVNIARRRAEELTQKNGKGSALFTDQFENLANFRAHFQHTGPEIWEQCGHHLDAFVMSAGTGGTLAGVGRFLKGVSRDIEVILADVQGSSLYNKVAHGVLYVDEQQERTVRRHRTDTIAEGIGLDRLTANFANGLPDHNGQVAGIDSAVKVSDQEALEMAHYLLAHEGLFIGSSAAVNCAAAVKVARRLPSGATVATILCDSGVRHVSRFYNPDSWPAYKLVAPAPRERGDLSFLLA